MSSSEWKEKRHRGCCCAGASIIGDPSHHEDVFVLALHEVSLAAIAFYGVEVVFEAHGLDAVVANALLERVDSVVELSHIATERTRDEEVVFVEKKNDEQEKSQRYDILVFKYFGYFDTLKERQLRTFRVRVLMRFLFEKHNTNG